MKKSLLFLLVILNCTAAVVNAQKDTVVMSLRDCMSYALSHSAKMRIQEANNRDAQISRRDAILMAFTPSVSAGSYAYSNFGRSIDPETNTYSQIASFHNGYSVSAGIDIFNGFQAVNNIKIAKTAQRMSMTQTQLLEDEICLATMEAYCNVVYYVELKKVLMSQLNTAESWLRLAERQEQLGQKSHTDVLQLQADLAKCQYRLTSCQNMLDNAIITLKDIMLWPLDEPLELEDTKGLTLFSSLNEQNAPSNVSDLIAYAQKHNGKALVADDRLRQARIALKTARWQYAPSLSLSGGWSTSFFTYPGKKGYTPMPFSDQIKNNSGEYIQLSLSIPIFNHLSVASNIARKKSELDRVSAEREQSLREIEAEVTRAVADRNGAADAMKQAQVYAMMQYEVLELNNRQLELGVVSPVDYRIVADNSLNAAAEYLNAQLQYFIKSSVVRYYAGERFCDQGLGIRGQ